MKELTIQEKAERYDAAIKEAAIAYKDEDKHLKATLERIFPEFKKSEDELTWLTKYIEEEAYYLSMDIRDNEDRIKLENLKKSLTWLEKQKPDEWSEEDKDTLERIIFFINSFVDKDLDEVVLNEEIFTDDAQQELKRYVDFLRNIENIKN